ncbi:hypothetical protein [Pseudomonas sp. NCIMB 10586]|uniref:hypothetical protein n=1 Tax=Pseudomonas sp. NCIMB 10586 TaxID=2558872 RepID=UPI0020050128|nr:hypothetical protein [Pseudomonas sp. NCIMB 10586]MCK3838866.1 hypothetical protein [Pseudomonas sp. NCIMB 10586]
MLNPSCLVALRLLILASSAHSEPKNLRLMGHSKAEGYSVQLTESDWRRLREKGKLVLGTPGPDYSPLGITTSGKDHEGLTADVSAACRPLAPPPPLKYAATHNPTKKQLDIAFSQGNIKLNQQHNIYLKQPKNNQAIKKQKN